MKREEFTYQTNTGEFVAEKLLPCPFCGGEPEFVTIGNDYTKSRKAEIKCIKCFCKRTTGAIHNNLEWCGRKAIELWNKRTAEHPLPPAEGAEEIRVEYSEESLGFFRSFIRARKELCAISPTETYSLEEAIRKTFDGFATLHAQKIADKMVSERYDDLLRQRDELKEALKQLVHLHGCEQEGLLSGQPTPEQWYKVVEQAEAAIKSTESNNQ